MGNPVAERVARALQECDFDNKSEASQIWVSAGDAYREEYRVRARAALMAERAARKQVADLGRFRSDPEFREKRRAAARESMRRSRSNVSS